METYSEIQTSSRHHNEKRDCTVRAVAAVTGVNYSMVHNLFKFFGRKKGRGTWPVMQEDVLHRLGFLLERTKEYDGKTILTLGRQLRDVKGSFYVYTSGHAIGIRDGRVMDGSRGGRKRIQTVFRVVRF